MRHRKIKELLAVYRNLEVAERNAVDEHLRGCPSCAASLAAYEEMDRALAALPDLPPASQSLVTLELAAVPHANQPQQTNLPRGQARAARPWGWLAPAGLLLILAVLAALGVYQWAVPGKPGATEVAGFPPIQQLGGQPPAASLDSPLPTPTPTPTLTSTPLPPTPTPTPWLTVTPLPGLSVEPASPIPMLPMPLGPAWVQPAFAVDNWGVTPGDYVLWQDGRLVVWTGYQLVGISPDDGAVVWRYPAEVAGPMYVLSLDSRQNRVAVLYSNQPVVNEGTVALLDAATGDLVWEKLMETPRRAWIDDANVYVEVFMEGWGQASTVIAFDVGTAEEVWRLEGCGLGWLAEQSLFVSCHQQGSGDPLVVKELSIVDGSEIASRPVAFAPSWANLTVADGVLVVHWKTESSPRLGPPAPLEETNRVTALDWSTGEDLWTGQFQGSPPNFMLDGADMLVGVDNQVLRRPVREEQPTWVATLPVGERPWVTYALRTGDEVLVGTLSGALYALDWNTGEVLWQQPAGDLLGQANPAIVLPLGRLGDDILVNLYGPYDRKTSHAVAGLRPGATATWEMPTPVPTELWPLFALPPTMPDPSRPTPAPTRTVGP